MKKASIIAGDPKPVPKPDPKPGHDGLWSPAPSKLKFPASRVDVWRVHLDEPLKAESGADVLSPAVLSPAVLSPDEIARARRFHFEKDRIHFARCRSALRGLLGDYLLIPAAEIHFEYLTSGKPCLAADQNPRALQFNVSHSANMALIAVGSEHRLGVDIERIRDDVDTASLAERFFSRRERDGLAALPNPLRVTGFYAVWTRKEAFLKATGDGLSFPLADFSVTTHPHRDPALEDIKGDPEAAKQWSLADLNVAEGYRATVAVEGPFSTLETYTRT
jgi:4'-phosphopantetheinyl transferase